MPVGIPHPVAPSAVLNPSREDRTDDGIRRAQYTKWRGFAEGGQWDTHAKRGEIRHTFNYGRNLIRKTAAYLFSGGGPTFQIGQPNEDFTEHEDALKLVVDELDLLALDLQLEEEAATIGDAAVKITWDTIGQRPRVVSVDPGTLVAYYAADNPSEPYQVSQTITLPGLSVLQMMPGADVDITKPYTVTEHWTAATWRLEIAGVAGGVSRDMPNPYEAIPYVVLANNRAPRQFWGRSDLIDLEDVCQAINTEITTLDQIMQLSGAPIAVLENVDGTEGIRVTPGAKWELPAESKAYLLSLLEGNGLMLHMEYFGRLMTSLHDLSETPKTAFGDTGRTISGAALEVEIQPLVQKVGRKRGPWNRFYRQRNRLILHLMARANLIAPLAPTVRMTTVWPSVLPSDFAQDVIDNVSLTAAGIRSHRTAVAALGADDPDAEMQLIEAEAQAASDRAIAETRASHPDDQQEATEESQKPAEKREDPET